MTDKNVDHLKLRELMYTHGIKNVDKYSSCENQTAENFLADLSELQKEGVWNKEAGKIAIPILQDILGVPIVIIRNSRRAVHYPEDEQVIDEQTIVIVQDDTSMHYNATKIRTTTGTAAGPRTSAHYNRLAHNSAMDVPTNRSTARIPRISPQYGRLDSDDKPKYRYY